MNPTRWKGRARNVGAGAASFDLFVPTQPGDVLEVRQLRVSASAAAEVVVYFSDTTTTPASAAAIAADDTVFGVFLAANGGASPDLGCMGAWASKAGQRLRVYVAAAATVDAAAEGLVE